MFSKWFNKKEKKEKEGDRDSELESDLEMPIEQQSNWSFLGADMHSHFVPGIDDGAQNIEESLSLIQGMIDLGFSKIITTPHIMVDMYPNTPQKIKIGLDELKMVLSQHEMHIEIEAAAEYFIDEYFMDNMDKEPLLHITKNEVLVEFSALAEPPMLKDALFKMVTTRIKPIIAHPERYNYFHKDFDRFLDFKDRGCLLQLNILSLCGFYGQGAKKIAETLLEKGMYDYCGTDTHNETQIEALRSMLNTKVYWQLKKYPFKNKEL